TTASSPISSKLCPSCRRRSEPTKVSFCDDDFTGKMRRGALSLHRAGLTGPVFFCLRCGRK
ncbi:hypothetical protein MUO32_26675, partial [Shinella sp. CPCC 101442]|uniref:hypothetical protein n=1 Tax=Shinella sp. CPCC 101442 TaxID=2932265 RepID=UPI00215251EC